MKKMEYPINALITFILYCIYVSKANPISDAKKAADYLKQFGYINEHDTTSNIASAMSASDVISRAVMDFQRYAGIPQTGVLNKETLKMMEAPRCGQKDRINNFDGHRRKRYVFQGSKWGTSRLTYKIANYPQSLRDRGRVDQEIDRAFQAWSEETPLVFERSQNDQVDIEVRFEKGYHGDPFPFDGPGRVLAHAYYPNHGGNAHFDDDETWTSGQETGTDLLIVAAHEIGHSLGLSHSDNTEAIMTPIYRGYKPYFRLHEDDINGIQGLYGSKDGRIPPGDPGPPTTTDQAAELCQDSALNTITRTQDGKTYIFKGNFYWEVINDKIAHGYPKKISDDWGGLEGNLDASVTLSDGKTYFFKDNRLWRFSNKNRDPDYPKPISSKFPGIPDNLDAAFIWSKNFKLYFFKGDKYWRFDFDSEPAIKPEFPVPLNEWDIPNDIDAAFHWNDNRTYFFKDNKYYKYNDDTLHLEAACPSYPRKTSIFWFSCPNPDDQRIILPESAEDELPTTLSDTTGAPNLCQNAKIDAVTRTKSGSTYFFKGDFYWRVIHDKIASGYPRRISDDWGGLEGNLDAAVTLPDGKTYFFKDGRFWRFTNKRMDPEYPKAIFLTFNGIPDNLDAAFIWGNNSKLYFVKGDRYWKFEMDSNPQIELFYPLPLSEWKGLPNNIDAAFQWDNNGTYFFRELLYYKFDDEAETVDLNCFPRPTAKWWFSC